MPAFRIVGPNLHSHLATDFSTLGSLAFREERYAVSIAQIPFMCYHVTVIASFGDKKTEAIFHGVNSKEARGIPRPLWSVICRKLDLLNGARELPDLSSPPGNRLEALKGTMKGLMSIRVNDQYRIVFRWADGNAHEVTVMDYH